MAGLVEKSKWVYGRYDEKVIISIKEKFINSLTHENVEGGKKEILLSLNVKRHRLKYLLIFISN